MGSAEPLHGPTLSDEVLHAVQRMATRYYSHGMYSDSICLLEFLLRHRSSRADIYYSLGKAKHAQSEYAEAITNYKRAVLLGLPDIEVHLYMGQCFIFMRKLPQAESVLRQFIALGQIDKCHRLSPLIERGQHLLNDLVLPQIHVL
jgi:tetratricopeptide (TPR) repeat protein